MHLRTFLQRVLPPAGTYACFTTGNRQHLWSDSIEQLSEDIQSLGERPDIYFATASYKEAGTAYKGRTQANVAQLKALRLDLDAGKAKFDTQGPDKVYETQRDAIAGLMEFTRATGLVFSLLVSSGEGLHVYYELGVAITPEQWLPRAQALQNLYHLHGLKADRSVTCDSARILRPLGTQHPNGKAVSLLRDTERSYTLAQLDRLLPGVEVPSTKYDLSVNDDITPAATTPRSFKRVLSRCAAVRWTGQNQSNTPEPLWRLAIGIAKHTVEGITAATAISQRHPQFDPGELQEKYDRWDTGPATCASFHEHLPEQCAKCPHWGKITSPIQLGDIPLKELVESDGPAPVPVEPEGNGTNDATDTPKPWDGCLPDKIAVIRHDGRDLLAREQKVPTADGGSQLAKVPFTADIFWLTHWSDAVDSNDTAQVTLVKYTEGLRRTYDMEQSVVASRADLLKYLASKGIHVLSGKDTIVAMETYVKDSLQKLKEEFMERPKISGRFGLRILEDGELVSAHGKYLIHGDGRIQEAVLTRELRSQSSTYTLPLASSTSGQWDKSVWAQKIMPAAKEHVEFLRRHYSRPGLEKFQLAITAAFASPLMAFVSDGYWRGDELPGNALTIAMLSEQGGRGKTTAMRAAQLAFGTPGALTRDGDSLNTTERARLARLAISGTMPVNLDEMGDMDSMQLLQLVRSIANGSARAALNADGTFRESHPWALTCLIGTNKSQRDIMLQSRAESSAEQYRLIELNVDALPPFGREAQIQFDSEWKGLGKVAGALGAIVQLSICSLGVDRINKLVADNVAKAANTLQLAGGTESASRFQFRALGAILSLYELMGPRGLMPFDEQAVVETFTQAYVDTVDYVQEHIQPSDGLALMAQALQDLMNQTVITKAYSAKPGPRIEGSTYDVHLGARMPDRVSARHVIDLGVTYLSSNALRHWCKEHRVSPQFIVHAAVQANLLMRPHPSVGAYGTETLNTGNPVQKRWVGSFALLGGMRENTGGRAYCYHVNTRRLHLAMPNEFPDITEKAIAEGKVVPLHPASPEADNSEHVSDVQEGEKGASP